MSVLNDYIKTKLNEEQYASAVHTDTSALILAGAGSGKTRVLTYKIAYLMFGKSIPLSHILAVTFTNKAAKEMKERLMHLSEELSTTLPGAHKIHFSRNNNWIGTFHSIFLRILKEDIDQTMFGFTKNFGVYDTDEAFSLIKKIMKDDKVDKVITPKEVKNYISKLKNEGTTADMYAKMVQTPQDNIIADTYKKYQTQLQITNAMDFDDLLLYPYRMFKDYPEILKKRQIQFQYILVDEAQDTNWIQFELMKQLTQVIVRDETLHNQGLKKPNITLIGDDFQSIYGRRGALMENFLNVKKIWPDIEIFKLQTNYRSKPHIVHAGSAVIKNNTKQYEKDIVAHRAGNEKIVIFNHTDESSEALNIVEFIAKLKEQNNKQWSDFAILYRTNAQSSPFEQVLVQEGVPYKIFGAFRFFDRKEVKDIVSYLKYLINNRDNVALKRIINIPSRKLGDTTIKKIEDTALTQEVSMHDVLIAIDALSADINMPTRERLKEFNKLIEYLLQKSTDLTPSGIIKQVIAQIDYKAHLLKEEGGNQQAADDRYANIGQLINMGEKYDELGISGLSRLMDEISLLTDAAENADESIDSIKLMTVHSSKGLEFKNVFLVGVEENVFPLGNARLEVKLLEEERRLMYVAITRAEDHLFISYADSRMQWGQTMYNRPSRFLEEIPEELKKTYSLAENRSFSRPSFDEGDIVSHKLFGKGTIIEIRGEIAIIKFQNTTFGVRKVPLKLVSPA
ncbi:ATP-dependent DNA helicase PcrA [candidate division SR1 bacterium Aalborg_AAW-1]|nr:ATP-dependent DNA helicase PcrA [candidate division SR1 bacterium Aalborg_AAW-1]